MCFPLDLAQSYLDGRYLRLDSWKVSLVPLGGYVKMASDLNAASQPDAKTIQAMTDEEKEGSLNHKMVDNGLQFQPHYHRQLFICILIFGVLYFFQVKKYPK